MAGKLAEWSLSPNRSHLVTRHSAWLLRAGQDGQTLGLAWYPANLSGLRSLIQVSILIPH